MKKLKLFVETSQVQFQCGRKLKTRRQVVDEIIDWLTFYNYARLHSTLGYVSPMQCEKSWYAAQLLKAA